MEEQRKQSSQKKKIILNENKKGTMKLNIGHFAGIDNILYCIAVNLLTINFNILKFSLNISVIDPTIKEITNSIHCCCPYKSKQID